MSDWVLPAAQLPQDALSIGLFPKASGTGSQAPVSILHSPGHHDLWSSHTSGRACCPLGTLTGPCFTLTAALRLPVTSPLPQKRPILQRCCVLEKSHDQLETELWTTLRVTLPMFLFHDIQGLGLQSPT